MSVLPTSQNKRRALIRGSMIVLGVLLVACAALARFGGVATHWPTLILLVAFGVLAILEFTVFDDVAKRAHYIAWYWGSLIGIVSIAVIQVVFAFTGEPFEFVEAVLIRWFGDADPQTSFLFGLLVTPVLMAIGFFIVRGIDWLRTR